MSKIFIFSPDFNEPSGGIRKLYKYVDQLNNWGYEAFIVHQKIGFSCTWFPHDTKINYLKDLKIQSNDILAFPEVSSHLVFEFKRGIRKIIINQNAYNTFGGFIQNSTLDPYLDKDVVAVLVHSEHDLKYIKYLYPSLNVYRMYCGIDNELFKYCENKINQIAYMPRKYEIGAQQLIKLLNHRKIVDNFPTIKIDNISLEDCARIMRESLIFLSFSSYEGFGLPPIEALSCGCIVIGFHGNGGKEYFKPEFCFPIEYGDLLNYVLTVENVLMAYKRDPTFFHEKTQKASKFVTDNYSLKIEEETALNFWRSLF